MSTPGSGDSWKHDHEFPKLAVTFFQRLRCRLRPLWQDVFSMTRQVFEPGLRCGHRHLEPRLGLGRTRRFSLPVAAAEKQRLRSGILPRAVSAVGNACCARADISAVVDAVGAQVPPKALATSFGSTDWRPRDRHPGGDAGLGSNAAATGLFVKLRPLYVPAYVRAYVHTYVLRCPARRQTLSQHRRLLSANRGRLPCFVERRRGCQQALRFGDNGLRRTYARTYVHTYVYVLFQINVPQASAVTEHTFLAPWRLALHGPCFPGQRHPWNIRSGNLSVEVLAWLRADDALVPGSPAFEALAVDFSAVRQNCKSEQDRKFILAGHVNDALPTRSMCGLTLNDALPLPRLRAWRHAFLAVNSVAFAAMQASAQEALRRLSEEDRGRNGDDFLAASVEEWCISCGELAFSYPGSQADGFWAEPEHMDGGASVLHLTMTLYGRRRLECRSGCGLPDVVLENTPGTVYIGQLTGPLHQVLHQQALESELLEVPGLGRLACTVMMRTSLFAHNRSRLRSHTPSPRACFEALARCFREGLASEAFRLPTLVECQEHMA